MRQKTGAGVLAVKEALDETKGDIEAAEKILKEQGLATAMKKSGRDTSQGVVQSYIHAGNKLGALVELKCETDFVAKNDDFVKMANNFADIALTVSSKEELLKADYNGISVEDKLTEQTGVIGEKIEIGAFKTLEAPFVGSYIHAGNKIAVITGLSKNVEGADEAAKNVSMQAAAMNPIALNEEGVDQETIDKEVEIAKDTLRQEGKPEEMLDKIAKGKIQRYFKDNTLVNQAFIKDGKQSVADYVKSVDSDLTVVGFERVALGE